MSGILYLVLALLVFGVIIFAHELGHYLAARASGITVLEFAIGFGPKLFGWRKKDIDYSLRLLPFGGYCKFEGEDDASQDPKAFSNAPVWKRFLTIFSGPAMNFVLAYLAVVVFLMAFGTVYTVPVVQDITSGMPAASSGLQAGDVITAVNGQPIALSEEGAVRLVEMISQSGPDKAVTLTVQRGGQSVDVTVSPQKTENGGKIGITLGSQVQRYSPFGALAVSGYKIYDITVYMVDSLKALIFHGQGVQDAMGPVGIISFMTQAIRQDFEQVVNLIVIISLNVGLINLLPFPGLDGGRLVFLLVEAIRRKPVKPEYEGWVHMVGFFLLIGLILVFTYRDIMRLVTGG
jgi:regulator of sigma E protease